MLTALLLKCVISGFYYRPAQNIDYLGANILSMPRFNGFCADISILTYIIKYKTVSLVGYFVCFILITALSALLESRIKAMTASSLVIFIPYATDYFGIPVLRFISFSYFIAPSDVFGGFTTYLFCSLSTVTALILACVKWNGKKTR